MGRINVAYLIERWTTSCKSRSWHTYERVMSHLLFTSHICTMLPRKKSRQTCECTMLRIMSHMWMRHTRVEHIRFFIDVSILFARSLYVWHALLTMRRHVRVCHGKRLNDLCHVHKCAVATHERTMSHIRVKSHICAMFPRKKKSRHIYECAMLPQKTSPDKDPLISSALDEILKRQRYQFWIQ